MGVFFPSFFLPLHNMAWKSPSPSGSGSKACVRKHKLEMVESWTEKCLPQSEFMLSLLKCCSQHEDPEMREYLMVIIKKGVENNESVF